MRPKITGMDDKDKNNPKFKAALGAYYSDLQRSMEIIIKYLVQNSKSMLPEDNKLIKKGANKDYPKTKKELNVSEPKKKSPASVRDVIQGVYGIKDIM